LACNNFRLSSERNKQPILEVLESILPATGVALEVASGTGQHVTWFAQYLGGWTWQPSDVDPTALEDTDARADQSHLSNVRRSILLNVADAMWSETGSAGDRKYDLVLCINMLHCSPWESCVGLMRGASQHLAPGGRLVTYGPYFENGTTPSPGNVEFDQSLRAGNPLWGIRQREQVELAAAEAGLRLAARHPMPANNLLLEWALS
jgi:hypothetical protein